MAYSTAFKAHLQTGATTIARAWEVVRSDGVRMGFTDHDQDLLFDGLVFAADGGLSAQALSTATGLSVDNAEALGALSDANIQETDIRAGRFDGAEVKAWLVNWQNVVDRTLQFRGSIGEIVNTGNAFRAELRGLTEALNLPRGRVFQTACGAVLGDSDCGFDVDAAGYSAQIAVLSVVDQRELHLPEMQQFADGSAAVGGWLGVMPGTKVDEDLALLKQVTDDYFAARDKDPALYRRLGRW